MAAPTGTIRRWRASGAINNGTAVTLRTPHNSLSTVYVTKFTVSIVTHATGKNVQLQDGAANVYAKHQDTAAGAGIQDCFVWDFGVSSEGNEAFGGVAMAVGQAAQAVSEAAGPAGYFFAEGYEIVPNPSGNVGA